MRERHDYMKNDLISIIIRAKNEEEWIGRTLSAIEKQTYQQYELIVVDSESSDCTVDIAKRFGCRVISYTEPYVPGKAINIGIRESKGPLIVVLSAHAVPVDTIWLETLVNTINEDEKIAGVYGRQLPIPESQPFDKRDLIITFGPEKKVQRKDSFFHNANSIIRRNLWERFPFDESATNIEDRLWAKRVQRAGYTIVYEPEARVYHHHGIHQYGNVNRCETTVKILENIEPFGVTKDELDRQLVGEGSQSVLAIMPISDEDALRLFEVPDGCDRSFLEYVLDEIQRATFLQHVVIATVNPTVIESVEVRGIWSFFYKTPTFSGPVATLEEVLYESLLYVQKSYDYFPTYTMFIKATHVFRPAQLIDGLIKKILIEKEDSVFVAKKEYRACWALEDGTFVRKDEGFIKRSEKDPLWLGYSGLGCITKTKFVYAGRRLGDSVALLTVDNVLTLFDIQDDTALTIAKTIAKQLFLKQKMC